MRRISLLNFKGGTGKSSMTQNLGHALARAGASVLVIDGDRQSNTTTTLLGKRAHPSLADVLTGRVTLADAIYEARPNLYVVPSETDLDHVATYLKEHRRAYDTLRVALEPLAGELDFVFFDQAGAFSPIMDALLIASDEMVIPCELEPYAVQGLFDMFAKLKSELGNELTNSGIIPYNVDRTKNMTAAYIADLRETFGDLVIDQVRTDTAVPYAQSESLTVFEYEEKHRMKSKAAEDFTRIARRFLARKEATV